MIPWNCKINTLLKMGFRVILSMTLLYFVWINTLEKCLIKKLEDADLFS